MDDSFPVQFASFIQIGAVFRSNNPSDLESVKTALR